MNARVAGTWMVGVGALAQAAGIVSDAFTHGNDPDLARREGIFALSNLSHAAFFAGLAVAFFGVVMLTVGVRIYRPVDARSGLALRLVRVGVPLAAIGLVADGAAAVGSSRLADGTASAAESGTAPAREAASDAGGHAGHGVVSVIRADGTSPCEKSGPPVSEGQVAGNHGERGPVVTEFVTSPAQRALLMVQLAAARDAAAKYPTAADAMKAGYVRVTPYVACIGAHYMSFGLVDGTFDPAAPEMILYDGDGPDARVVGLSYYAVTGDEPPEGFATNDPWHQHIGLCVDGTGVIGAESLTEEECRAIGGTKADGSDAWMDHVWVVPGWESSWGLFSGEHAELGALPVGEDALWKAVS